MNWLTLAGWIVGWVLLWRLPRPASGPTTRIPERVAVVVPARNEADRLPTLLGTLARQTRRPDQVVVVDDASADETAEIARRFDGVELVTAPPVPAGWTGKSWACATGVEASEGDVIVFLDADVALADEALASVLASWASHRGLLSVQPHHHVERPAEALSLVFNVVTMMGIGIGSLVPARREWAAAGPCMVTSRADYELAGGHAAVRGEVAEDLELAGRFASLGRPVRCLEGGTVVRYRMYRDLRGIVEGWGKNLATGARRTPPVRMLAIVWWLSALLTVAMQVTDAIPLLGGGTDLPTAAALYAACALQVAVLARQVGRFGPAAAFWPLLLLFFVGVFVWSSLRTLVVRQVRWSGRTIRVAARH